MNRFIDPFFMALGWEFDQTGIKRYLWDVHREFSQKDNSSTKKPDYAFRLKGKLKFFVEAKAPWVPLTDSAPVFQAKRYAFSTNGRAPIVVITDFQEFRVFNSLERPVFNNPLQGLLREFDLTYNKYIEKWDLIYGTFSKEAVESGSLDILRGKISRAARTLDDEFLKDIVSWRETLARNIAIRNKNLSVNEINESVQRILDRLIFIRNLEDRDIQPEDRLLNIARLKEGIYGSLIPLFNELDKEYNGILFKKHFSEELEVDDKAIKDLIKSMCYPESPFQFDVIEPEILGRIYEKFLGSKIRLTENHQAKVEEKPEVRHAGGVYYTPQFIVDYIVQNTIGKTIDGLTPEEIRNIKILDPACGSGSFLIGAYDYIIKYHEKFYMNVKTQNAASKRKYKDDFFETGDEEVRLTLAKKGEILINNIFGVDIDREAAEVAVMSLYLKLLEHGFYEEQSFMFMKGHVLPDLEKNIQCGNSLLQDHMFGLNINIEEKIQLKPFEWNIRFKDIMGDKKFDCVIGNPPYIRSIFLKETDEFLWKLYRENYKSAQDNEFDIYLPFLELGSQLINENGCLSYIMPNKWLHAKMGQNMREYFLKTNQIFEIVNFKAFQVFENATNYTMIITISGNKNNFFKYYEYCGSPDEKNITLNFEKNNWDQNDIKYNELTIDSWSFQDEIKAEILKKISNHKTLDNYLKIGQGTGTRADGIYFVTKLDETEKEYKILLKDDEKEYWIEKKYVKPSIKGKSIDKFSIVDTDYLLIFPYEDKELIPLKTIKVESPKLYELFMIHKNKLELRENGRWKGNNFHCYGRP